MEGFSKRVLIVDNDDGSRHMLRSVLTKAGYRVHEAEDGLKAVAEMKRQRFYAVICDYRLPKLDGLEFLALTRTLWSHTPVILTSLVESSIHLEERAMAQGAFAWLRRPYEPMLVRQLVDSATQQASKEKTQVSAFD